MEEERIKEALETYFAFLKDKVMIKRKGRMLLEVDKQNFHDVLIYLIKNMHFTRITTITGLDEVDSFALVYHLDNANGITLNLKLRINKDNPVVKTITPYFLNADIYEREIMDLLGIRIDGLAPGNRYPLPDNWPQGQYPLRKDWKEGVNA